MTKKEFNNDINVLIERLVLKSMKSYASQLIIEDQIEAEPIDDNKSIFVDDDYADDLRDRYNQLKGG